QLLELLLDVVLIPVGTELGDQLHGVVDLQRDDGMKSERHAVGAHDIGQVLLETNRLHGYIHPLRGHGRPHASGGHRSLINATMSKEPRLSDQYDLVSRIGCIAAAAAHE